LTICVGRLNPLRQAPGYKEPSGSIDFTKGRGRPSSGKDYPLWRKKCGDNRDPSSVTKREIR
jgi:hypothetical protein